MAIKKTYTHVPPMQVRTQSDKLARVAAGITLFPLSWARAHRQGLPGLRFAIDSFRFGLSALFGGRKNVSTAEVYRMLFDPVESTRYFEFGLAWDFVSNVPGDRYLDVSSPRLFPLTLVKRRQQTIAELINPGKEDLRLTSGVVKACGLAARCTLWDCLIEDAPFPPSTFDLITSISVVEHIPDDKSAVQQMWRLLKPGGRLVLSVPCGAIAEEQYIDADQFGLQKPDKEGYFFLQYIYDQVLLEERFYSVLGSPARHKIYGETEPGSLRRSLIKKWSGGKYPGWREPYTMAQDFQSYKSLADLPGEGVIVMEFNKS